MSVRRVKVTKYVAVGLSIIAASLRIVSLRELPVFGDEAIYLRIARIVRADPAANLWTPLRAPSPPLHSWLLAAALPLSPDPVRAGRLLSVFLGVLLVPALLWAVRRIEMTFSQSDRDAAARPWALTAAALAATSPFLVFADRLSRVDTLFTLETVLAAGLAVVLAARPGTARAARFGLVMGLAMLTRQAMSYFLWLLPLVVMLLLPARNRRRFFVCLGLSVVVAIVLWMPMLVVPGWTDVLSRMFYLPMARPSLDPAERFDLLAGNLALVGRAFWTYLTPPVFLAAIAGLAWLLVTRRRLFTFLLLWAMILLLPTTLFAVDYFPRYALVAAPPLFVAGGLVIASLWTRARPWVRAVLAVAIVAWPAADLAQGLQSWQRWRLLPIDRQQFVSGWSAGLASEKTASFLEERARERPITVIVPHVSGNPSDAVWLALDGEENVQLFYAEDFLRKPALEVRGDVWTDASVTSVDSDLPAFFVSQDPAFLGREGWAPAGRIVLPLNPGARVVARFENPPSEQGRVESAVEVYQLR